MAISSIYEVANPESKTAEVDLYNNDGKTMYVKLTMSKVSYKNKEKVITPLSKSSLPDWKLSVTPSKIIMRDGERKAFRMHYLCGANCNLESDEVYAVDVSPVPYNEFTQSTSLAMAFGFRVYFLVPATNPKVKYNLKWIDKAKGIFSLENNSNTMLTAVLNVCTKEFSSDCIFQYRVLSGSKKEFTIPVDKVLHRTNGKIEMNMISPDEKYNEIILL
ncbi:TPA: pilus assembly protein [Photobacterium damselae]